MRLFKAKIPSNQQTSYWEAIAPPDDDEPPYDLDQAETNIINLLHKAGLKAFADKLQTAQHDVAWYDAIEAQAEADYLAKQQANLDHLLP